MTQTFHRGRRTRMTPELRQLVEETRVQASDLISPYFVITGENRRVDIDSMPGVARLSPDLLLAELKEIHNLGVKNVILFGVIEDSGKDEKATSSYSEKGPVQQAVSLIKANLPGMTVITDVCLCGYTDHGHCGVLDSKGRIENDESLNILAKMALSHAQAGADVVAPSDMMDGRVKVMRSVLDESGFSSTPILSYAAKYASGFYGPFRDAAQSAMKRGEKSRKSYQMDPKNVREALREIEADINEGADMIMVKPALAYLDVIRAARERFDVPISAYSVSGEYSMIKAAAQKGWIDEKAIVIETLTAIRRAGADRILTYFAKDFAQWMKDA